MSRLAELLRRTAGFLLGLVLLALAFVFASVLFALVAALALLIGGWFWWRTRQIRSRAAQGENVVIEGEYRVEREANRLEDPGR
jgi:hypothetical protein